MMSARGTITSEILSPPNFKRFASISRSCGESFSALALAFLDDRLEAFLHRGLAPEIAQRTREPRAEFGQKRPGMRRRAVAVGKRGYGNGRGRVGWHARQAAFLSM